MSHILIVGKKFSTLTDYLLEHGHEYTYLQDILTTKFPDKRFKRRVLADFSSKETLLQAVDGLKTRPDAVLATYENYILPTAWITDHLNLPGLPISCAEACTDKQLMRMLFENAPEKISPAFMAVANEDELRTFAEAHNFPFILKPANLSKSLLVTKNDSIDELLVNYRKSVDLLQTTYKKYAPNRTPKLLVEEFLEGTIHSVDAFIDADGNPDILQQVVDYQTGYDIGFEDNFHYSRILPSKLSIEDQLALQHCAEVGIRALGMKNSPAHVEIIMTSKGPRIVEIGARNGGYRERMHAVANGIDITGAALSLALGVKPSIKAYRNDPMAVLELFPKVPGNFAGVSRMDELKELPSLNYISVKAKENSFIGKAADGHKMAAIIILHNTDSGQFDRDLDFVNNNVAIQTR